MTARVLLADDHVVVRRGLRLVLDAEPDLEVVAEAGDGLEAVEAAVAEDVDLAVLDVSMPGLTGIQAARELRRRAARIPVVILSMHDGEQYFAEARDAGAAAYVLKSSADTDLVDACRAALRHEPFVRPRGREDDFDGVEPDVLTPRELEVLKLVAEAHSSREIAELLVISTKTVERHRANLLEKLGMSDRVELTRYAIRRGLVEP